jgi:hypothetical protein
LETQNRLLYQKKRVRKHPAHWLPSTNLGIHVFLIYSTQIRRPNTPSKLSSYWRFRTLQNRKHTNALLPRVNSTDSTAYISYLSKSYKRQHGKLSYCIYRLCTIYENTSSTFHQLFTKKTDPRCCLLSHSSVVARLITRRNGKLSYSAKLWLLLALLHTDRLSFSQLFHS